MSGISRRCPSKNQKRRPMGGVLFYVESVPMALCPRQAFIRCTEKTTLAGGFFNGAAETI